MNTNVEKAKKQSQPKFHIVNGPHQMKGIAVLQHRGKRFEIFSAPNNAPIEADGMLGNDFLITFGFHQVDVINNKLKSEFEELPLDECPIVTPPRTIKRHTIKVNHTRDQFVADQSVIPGIYKNCGRQIKLYVANEAPYHENSYRSLMEVDFIDPVPAAMSKKRRDTLPGSHRVFHTVDRLKLLKDNVRLSHLGKQEHDAVWKIISKYDDVFMLPGDKLPDITIAQHEIKLIDKNAVVNCRNYRYPQAQLQEISRQVEKLKEQGIIRESESN